MGRGATMLQGNKGRGVCRQEGPEAPHGRRRGGRSDTWRWGPGLPAPDTCVPQAHAQKALSERSQQVPSQEMNVAQSEVQGTRRILPSNVFIEQCFRQFHPVLGDFSGSKAQGDCSKSSRGELKMESFQRIWSLHPLVREHVPELGFYGMKKWKGHSKPSFGFWQIRGTLGQTGRQT